MVVIADLRSDSSPGWTPDASAPTPALPRPVHAARSGSGKGLHDAGCDARRRGRAADAALSCSTQVVQADALGYLATHWQEFDAIHAAPPCQDHSISTHDNHGTGWLLTAVLSFLRSEVNIPWVVENVPGAPLTPHYRLLCGCVCSAYRI